VVNLTGFSNPVEALLKIGFCPLRSPDLELIPVILNVMARLLPVALNEKPATSPAIIIIARYAMA
jgi:hypothetical protein